MERVSNSLIISDFNNVMVKPSYRIILPYLKYVQRIIKYNSLRLKELKNGHLIADEDYLKRKISLLSGVPVDERNYLIQNNV